MGWCESILGYTRATPLNLHPDARSALEALATTLGEERYLSLKAVGASMTDEEALRYAEEQVATTTVA